MIDLYYRQHSDRRLAASKEEICLGWDPPDEARRRPAWTPYRRHAAYVGRS